MDEAASMPPEEMAVMKARAPGGEGEVLLWWDCQAWQVIMLLSCTKPKLDLHASSAKHRCMPHQMEGHCLLPMCASVIISACAQSHGAWRVCQNQLSPRESKLFRLVFPFFTVRFSIRF